MHKGHSKLTTSYQSIKYKATLGKKSVKLVLTGSSIRIVTGMSEVMSFSVLFSLLLSLLVTLSPRNCFRSSSTAVMMSMKSNWVPIHTSFKTIQYTVLTSTRTNIHIASHISKKQEIIGLTELVDTNLLLYFLTKFRWRCLDFVALPSSTEFMVAVTGEEGSFH